MDNKNKENKNHKSTSKENDEKTSHNYKKEGNQCRYLHNEESRNKKTGGCGCG